MGTANRVLVLTTDTLGPAMAGPGIRSVEFARALAPHCSVTVASPHPVDTALPNVATASFSGRRDLEALAARHDVIVGIAGLLAEHRWLASGGALIVADAYDPVLFEVLEWFADAPPDDQERRARDARQRMTAALRFADVVLCASDRQRLMLIGSLVALGRVNPANYAGDPSLERLVRVVPFGLPSTPPRPASASLLRGTAGPFAPDDFVLLWGGGVYEWLDPITLVEAVAGTPDPAVKAVVLGGSHPTPGVPAMPIAQRARARAADLGVLGSRVVFLDSWVNYSERTAYLLDADVGVSLHRDHLEAMFAFRTRMLDYLWAGLPVLCTDGDSFAELVRSRGLGEVVPPEDPTAVSVAIERLRGDRYDECRRAVRGIADDFTWERVTQPLVDFCRAPAPARDRASGRSRLTELVLRAARWSRDAGNHVRTRIDTK